MDELLNLKHVTFAIAVLGAVLGIMNTWRNFDKDRVKLKVIPKHAIPIGPLADEHLKFCIDVINQSGFAIGITDVGFLHKGTSKRSAIISPVTADGIGLPRRLEARSSVSFYCQRPLSAEGHAIKCAYAKTDCGRLFKGKSMALHQVVDENRNV